MKPLVVDVVPIIVVVVVVMVVAAIVVALVVNPEVSILPETTSDFYSSLKLGTICRQGICISAYMEAVGLR